MNKETQSAQKQKNIVLLPNKGSRAVETTWVVLVVGS